MTEARPSETPTQDIFASIAHRYDLANRVTSGWRDVSWRRAAAGQLDLPHEGVVLDLATGTGDLAIADVRYASAARVVATDVSDEMMDVGRAKIEREDLSDRIAFSRADAQALPFDDGSFDGVTVGFGVRNFADRPRAFAEIARVLKPTRRFVCLEFTTPPNGLVRVGYRAYLKTVVPAVGWLLTKDVASYEYLAESIKAFPDAPSLAAMLENAGFDAVTYDYRTFGAVAVHVATR